jgi:hypothetical protein
MTLHYDWRVVGPVQARTGRAKTDRVQDDTENRKQMQTQQKEQPVYWYLTPYIVTPLACSYEILQN